MAWLGRKNASPTDITDIGIWWNLLLLRLQATHQMRWLGEYWSLQARKLRVCGRLLRMVIHLGDIFHGFFHRQHSTRFPITIPLLSHGYSIVIPLLSHEHGFVGNMYHYDHYNNYDNDNQCYYDHDQIGWFFDWKIAPCRKIWTDRHVNSYWNNDTWQYMKSISILFGFPIHFLRWVPGTSTAASPVCCPGTAAKSAACRPNSWVTPWWRSAAPKTRRPGEGGIGIAWWSVGSPLSEWLFPNGYGSIPIFIPFLGWWTSINPSYFEVHQGYKVLTHPQIEMGELRLLTTRAEPPSTKIRPYKRVCW